MKKLIYKNYIFSCITILLFVNFPQYIIGNIALKGLSLLKICFSIIIFIIYIKRGKLSKIVLSMIIFQLFLFLSTIINGNYNMLSTSLNYLLSISALYCYFDIGIKEYKNDILKISFIVLNILNIINCITFFLYYPNGMSIDTLGDVNYYFLGHDNGSIFYILPTILISFYYSFNKYNKIDRKIIFLLLFYLISYVYIWSVNAIITICGAIFFALFYKNIIFDKISGFKIFLFYLFFFIVIVVLNSNFKILIEILNFFKRDITFSGRAIFWKNALLNYFPKRMFFGYGYESSDILIAKFGYVKLHNLVIQILYNGGLVGIFLYLKVLFMSFKQYKMKNNNLKKTGLFILFLYLLVCLFDFYMYAYFTHLIYLFLYNNFIFEEEEKYEN